MADVNANLNIVIKSDQAQAQLRALQHQISSFNTAVIKSNTSAAAGSAALNKALMDGINATRLFEARIVPVTSSIDGFTQSLEKNKFSLGQYTRFAASQLPGMSKVFTREFDTMERVAKDRVKKMQTQYIALGKTAQGINQAIAITPTGLPRGYATDLAIATQKHQLLNKIIDDGSTKLLNWGKNTQWAGRQLMVGLTLPLVALGTAASRAFMEIDKATVSLSRVYGDLSTTTAELESNIDAVKSLGEEYTKYGIAVKDTIEISARAAATGATNEKLMAATEQTLRFATLGQIEYGQALDTTISLQTAFGLGNDELAQKIDYLNAVENQTILTMSDMSIAIPRVATVIKGLGGNVEDLAIMMTAMREGGVSAENAANALKSGLASMINPTKQANEFLSKLGINLNAIVGANKGNILGTVQAFGTELDKLGSFERQQALEKVFGKYQYARMSALFSNITKQSSQAARAMDLTTKSAKELADISNKELGKVSESTTVKFKASVEKLKLAIAPLGEAFLKAATPMLEMISKVAEAFNNLPDGVKNALAVVIGAVGGLGPVLLMGIGLMGNLLANVVKGIQWWRRLGSRLRGTGSEFRYLTEAEILANAATTSLEKSSGILTQTLLIQNGAVASLTKQYERMAIAAGIAGVAMGGVKGGSLGRAGGVKPQLRFATGGIVPGTGNGDTIPALLTPGESVITKEATQKYAPILQQMNDGSLPGFAFGGVDIARMFRASSRLMGGARYAPMRSVRSAYEEGSLPYSSITRRKGLGWLKLPFASKTTPGEVVGHIHTRDFQSRFGGEKPILPSSEVPGIHNLKNRPGGYELLPNQYMKFPQSINDALRNNKLSSSMWSNRKKEDMISIYNFLESRGVSREVADKVAERAAQILNQRMITLRKPIGELDFGGIVTGSTVKALKQYGDEIMVSGFSPLHLAGGAVGLAQSLRTWQTNATAVREHSGMLSSIVKAMRPSTSPMTLTRGTTLGLGRGSEFNAKDEAIIINALKQGKLEDLIGKEFSMNGPISYSTAGSGPAYNAILSNTDVNRINFLKSRQAIDRKYYLDNLKMIERLKEDIAANRGPVDLYKRMLAEKEQSVAMYRPSVQSMGREIKKLAPKGYQSLIIDQSFGAGHRMLDVNKANPNGTFMGKDVTREQEIIAAGSKIKITGASIDPKTGLPRLQAETIIPGFAFGGISIARALESKAALPSIAKEKLIKVYAGGDFSGGFAERPVRTWNNVTNLFGKGAYTTVDEVMARSYINRPGRVLNEMMVDPKKFYNLDQSYMEAKNLLKPEMNIDNLLEKRFGLNSADYRVHDASNMDVGAWINAKERAAVKAYIKKNGLDAKNKEDLLIAKDKVQQAIIDGFGMEGWHGFTHLGGGRAGRGERMHQVYILHKPPQSIRQLNMGDIGIKPMKLAGGLIPRIPLASNAAKKISDIKTMWNMRHGATSARNWIDPLSSQAASMERNASAYGPGVYLTNSEHGSATYAGQNLMFGTQSDALHASRIYRSSRNPIALTKTKLISADEVRASGLGFDQASYLQLRKKGYTGIFFPPEIAGQITSGGSMVVDISAGSKWYNKPKFLKSQYESNIKAAEQELALEKIRLVEQQKRVEQSNARSSSMLSLNSGDVMLGSGKVPGIGNTDKIPALLTPGESVITREATQKYAPILREMNAGTLPGFINGVVDYSSEKSFQHYLEQARKEDMARGRGPRGAEWLLKTQIAEAQYANEAAVRAGYRQSQVDKAHKRQTSGPKRWERALWNPSAGFENNFLKDFTNPKLTGQGYTKGQPEAAQAKRDAVQKALLKTSKGNLKEQKKISRLITKLERGTALNYHETQMLSRGMSEIIKNPNQYFKKTALSGRSQKAFLKSGKIMTEVAAARAEFRANPALANPAFAKWEQSVGKTISEVNPSAATKASNKQRELLKQSRAAEIEKRKVIQKQEENRRLSQRGNLAAIGESDPKTAKKIEGRRIGREIAMERERLRALGVREESIRSRAKTNVALERTAKTTNALERKMAIKEGKVARTSPRNQSKRPKMGMRGGMAGLGMGLMMASMAPMMMQDEQGKFLGMDANNMMLGMMGAGTLLTLPPKLAIGMAALAAVITPIVLRMKNMRESIDKVASEGMKLGQNMGGAAGRMEELSSATGYAFAKDRMKARSFRFTPQDAKNASQFSSYFEGDKGKAFIEELKGLSSEDRYKKVASIIAQGVADGMDPKTAQAYGNAIAAYANDSILKSRLMADFRSGKFKTGSDALVELVQQRNTEGQKAIAAAGGTNFTQVGKALGGIGAQGNAAEAAYNGTRNAGIIGGVAGGAAGTAVGVSIAGSLLAAGTIGATAGSVVPVIGTLIGAAIGVAIGLGAAWIANKAHVAAVEQNTKAAAVALGSSLETLKEVSNAEAAIAEERAKGAISAKKAEEELAKLRDVENQATKNVKDVVLATAAGNVDAGAIALSSKNALITQGGFTADQAQAVLDQTSFEAIAAQLFPNINVDDLKSLPEYAAYRDAIATVISETLTGITPENMAQKIGDINNVWATIGNDLVLAAQGALNNGGLTASQARGIAAGAKGRAQAETIFTDAGKELGPQGGMDAAKKRAFDAGTVQVNPRTGAATYRDPISGMTFNGNVNTKPLTTQTAETNLKDITTKAGSMNLDGAVFTPETGMAALKTGVLNADTAAYIKQLSESSGVSIQEVLKNVFAMNPNITSEGIDQATLDALYGVGNTINKADEVQKIWTDAVRGRTGNTSSAASMLTLKSDPTLEHNLDMWEKFISDEDTLIAKFKGVTADELTGGLQALGSPDLAARVLANQASMEKFARTVSLLSDPKYAHIDIAIATDYIFDKGITVKDFKEQIDSAAKSMKKLDFKKLFGKNADYMQKNAMDPMQFISMAIGLGKDPKEIANFYKESLIETNTLFTRFKEQMKKNGNFTVTADMVTMLNGMPLSDAQSAADKLNALFPKGLSPILLPIILSIPNIAGGLNWLGKGGKFKGTKEAADWFAAGHTPDEAGQEGSPFLTKELAQQQKAAYDASQIYGAMGSLGVDGGPPAGPSGSGQPSAWQNFLGSLLSGIKMFADINATAKKLLAGKYDLMTILKENKGIDDQIKQMGLSPLLSDMIRQMSPEDAKSVLKNIQRVGKGKIEQAVLGNAAAGVESSLASGVIQANAQRKAATALAGRGIGGRVASSIIEDPTNAMIYVGLLKNVNSLHERMDKATGRTKEGLKKKWKEAKDALLGYENSFKRLTAAEIASAYDIDKANRRSEASSKIKVSSILDRYGLTNEQRSGILGSAESSAYIESRQTILDNAQANKEKVFAKKRPKRGNERIKIWKEARDAAEATVAAAQQAVDRAVADAKITVTMELESDFASKSYSERMNSVIDQYMSVMDLKRQIAEIEDIEPLQKQLDLLQQQDEAAARNIELRQRDLEVIDEKISKLEDEKTKINDLYDIQFKALDQIEQANQRILAQQQGQLALAQALSVGDVAAAAKAQQDLQQQMATDQQQGTRNSLEMAREAQIKEIDRQINSLKDDRKVIEDDIKAQQLAQRAIQDSIYNKQQQINNKTRELDKIYDTSQAKLVALKNELSAQEIILTRLVALWQKYGGGALPAGVDAAAGATSGAGTAAPSSTQTAPTSTDTSWTNGGIQYRFDPGTMSVSKWDAATQQWVRVNTGGLIKKYSIGGNVLGAGGRDSVPTMLTPGEFVMRKASVDKFGSAMFQSLNMGSVPRFNMPEASNYGISNAASHANQNSAVYNYDINVNVAGTNASPEEIANTVMTKIKMNEDRKIRSYSF